MDLPDEAQAYAQADFAAVNDAFVQRLLELAPPRERAEALDLGTGPCDIPIRLLRRRPQWRVVAVDASAPMLKLARLAVRKARLASRIVLLQADAKALPLPDRSFDVVFSNSILHHVTAVDRLWAEVRRLVRPGAAIFFRDLARPASARATRKIVRAYAAGESKLLQEEYYRSLLSAWTPEEVRRQLKRAGLAGLTVAMVTDRHLDVFGTVR